MKRWFTKLALWILDGQYVPAGDLSDANAYYATVLKEYEDAIETLQVRATVAESALTAHVCPQRDYTENVQNGSPQMIDIRVPKKVRK